MKRTLAACLTAAFLAGGAGTALAQERGHHGYGKGGSQYGKTYRGGNKATHNNRGNRARHVNPGQDRAQHRRNANRNAYQGNRTRYSYGNSHRYNAPYRTHGNYGNQYRHTRVYRGQVFRPHYGWQAVPPAYARRLHHRPGHRYYRSGNDIVLVAIATGLVVDVLLNAID